jgi:mono/diheme cytochrome c family protein
MRVIHLMAVLFGTSLVGAAIATWLITTPRPAFAHDAEPALDGQADAAKGKLIFAAGDCASCHASPGQ